MKKIHRILIVTTLLIVSLNMQTAFAADYDLEYKPPGKYYLMFGSFRMYIHCQGEGNIPVIIEPGIGDSLANWLEIQTTLSQHTKVCLYDRAGYGLSDPGPGPRNPSQITLELYNLLIKAKVEGPYIIVGHSFGGYVAQYFANVLPQLTAGVVLVDSSHPDQVERLAELDKLKDKPKQNVGGYKFEDESLLTPAQKLWKHLNAQRKSVWTQMDELGSFKESAEEIKNLENSSSSIPVAVLTRGKSQLPIIEGKKSLEIEWQTIQKDLTNLSDNSWQVIVKGSGHSIHQEAPDAVISNTLKTLELAKKDLTN